MHRGRFINIRPMCVVGGRNLGHRFSIKDFLLVHFALLVCPQLIFMSYYRFSMYYPGMYYIFVALSLSDSFTSTLPHFLRLGFRCGARLRLRPASYFYFNLFALQTSFAFFIINLYLEFRLKC